MSGDHNQYQKTKSYLNDDFECPRCGHCCQALETEQEPVAWMHNFITGNVITHIPADIGRHPERWTPLYITPPKAAEWVGLTDEEVSYCRYAATFCDELDTAYMAELIEQALKEKNQ